MKYFWRVFAVLCFFSVGFGVFYSTHSPQRQVSSEPIREEDAYHARIQKIFDNRCVVCHSCNNAPCQLNLTTFNGVRRGATQAKVYDSSRRHPIIPTRIDVDETTEGGWRRRAFFPVISDQQPGESMLLKAILHKTSSTELDKVPVLDGQVCPVSEQYDKFAQARPLAGMPYNLPPLSSEESRELQAWIRAGAPGSVYVQPNINQYEAQSLKNWEEFLNTPKNENKLVSRYLYEHLFLAHVHFSENPKQFFRLVRSNSGCGSRINEVATRRPNDDPGPGSISYCFKPIQQTIVEKTHMPYLMDDRKLSWIKQNFFGIPWSVAQLPSYEQKTAANPFVTFEAIPVKARYRFLIQDSQYHISTFIKGPVCNGTTAVNSIDDQFYVFFMDPSSDLMVRDPDFREATKNLLVVPAEMGSDAEMVGLATYFKKYPPLRNQYRQLREAAIQKNFPQGLALTNIWDGGLRNENGVVTVFRHNDNSYVLKGARGDASHSAFVLDYALFERLVYNLVVGFDVYGNLTHQLHTRVYMGMIRMEGEGNFLDFFPPALRDSIFNDWYSSKLGGVEKRLIDRRLRTEHVSQVAVPKFLTPNEARADLYQRILTERLPYIVQRNPDTINWKSFNFPQSIWHGLSTVPRDQTLSALSVNGGAPGNAWVQNLPDVTMIVVKSGNSVNEVYTLIRNKKFKTEGSMLFESQMRQPELDGTTILPGLAASYPNYFFVVQENELSSFVGAVQSAQSKDSWKQVRSRWGLERMAPTFWAESDLFQDFLKRKMGVEAGVIDYTHYDVWTD